MPTKLILNLNEKALEIYRTKLFERKESYFLNGEFLQKLTDDTITHRLN